MLTAYDDFPIHQTARPVLHPATGDLNFYDRYWFGGLSKNGDFMFEIAHGVYPNRLVADAALCVSRNDGWQHSVLASRRAPHDRRDTTVGPIEVRVLEPMRTLQVVVGPNDTGVEADLTFRARTAAVEEPPMLMYKDDRLLMETSRLTQFGMWEGYITADGKRTEVSIETSYGMRDRSWGVRPVGEFQPGVPQSAPEVFWMWAPVHFDDFCTHFGIFEDPRGHRFYTNAASVPAHDVRAPFDPLSEEGLTRIEQIEREIEWVAGTRRASRVRVRLLPQPGEPIDIDLEPMLMLHMQGAGYGHPEFGHGTWQGELAVRGESWNVLDEDPLLPRSIHIHQLCRARYGGREGIAVCEQVVYGPHEPSGFKELLDGAA